MDACYTDSNLIITGVNGLKFTKFYAMQTIVALNVSIDIAIFHYLWNASTTNEGYTCQFSLFTPKFNWLPITTGTLLEQSKNKCHINHLHSHAYQL